MKKDKLGELSLKLADLCEHLSKDLKANREYNYSDQIKRCSSSICANIGEASHPQSIKDMISKFEIALKEAFETDKWLKMIFNANLISKDELDLIDKIAIKIRVLLIASVKTLKSKL